MVIAPLTAGQGKTSGINVYGTVSGHQSIYRVNGLTGDPNHLGVMLCVPLLLLLPRWLPRTCAASGAGAHCCSSFLLITLTLTLSRSAPLLGDLVGLAVLSPPILPRMPSGARLAWCWASPAALFVLALHELATSSAR